MIRKSDGIESCRGAWLILTLSLHLFNFLLTLSFINVRKFTGLELAYDDLINLILGYLLFILHLNIIILVL
jgi:hypothetical protein